MLRAYGAPAAIVTDKFVAYLNALAKRHASLLSAIARYLLKKGWKFTEEEFFRDLIKGRYAAAMSDEIAGRLLRTVESEQSRELLYRLSLVFNSFTKDDVDLLA